MEHNQRPPSKILMFTPPILVDLEKANANFAQSDVPQRIAKYLKLADQVIATPQRKRRKAG